MSLVLAVVVVVVDDDDDDDDVTMVDESKLFLYNTIAGQTHVPHEHCPPAHRNAPTRVPQL
jgi:hypothetical protein